MMFSPASRRKQRDHRTSSRDRYDIENTTSRNFVGVSSLSALRKSATKNIRSLHPTEILSRHGLTSWQGLYSDRDTVETRLDQLARFVRTIDYSQWSKCLWTQGIVVPAALIIEIQRSHASNLIKHAQWPTTICLGAQS